MNVIPVIDLKAGQVVQARKGDRKNYRPIQTPLSPSSDPIDVVGGLQSVFPFRVLYIADLDSIGGRGDHASTIRDIARKFPALELWVDGGFHEQGPVKDLLGLASAHAVVGSESQKDASLLEALSNEPRIILSLDSLGARRLDPAEIASRPELWPERIIVMTLDRVGAMDGPDLKALHAVRERCNGRSLYAAGGVRGRDDLDELQRLGVRGALVASALHGGALSSADIERIAAAR
ncbi:MAG: HisA/HisF-related TIM barrel protein [Parvibaculaceae bacterium]